VDLSFTRRTRRDAFVIYKDIPAEMGRVREWYERVLLQQRIAREPAAIAEVAASRRIDWVLSERALDLPFLQPVDERGSWRLYRVVPER
jgi:hypothetical protein